jgi:L-alanine-DL-glutamate epimerase-like enolase superfamily enzyme
VSGPEAAVTGLEVAAYTVPTDGPEADGTLAWDSTTIVVVRARCGDLTGTGWTYGPSCVGSLIGDLLEPVVVGGDALTPAAGQSRMVRAVRNAGRPGLAAMAISAVDTALWDLAARLLHLPLHRLLGADRSEVPVYGSGGFTNYDHGQLQRQLEGWLADGIDQVKLKIGESWGTCPERDLRRVGEARAVAGESTSLFVDANGGYSVKQAVRVGRDLDELGVTWFEEPVSSDDPTGLRFVRDHVLADVTAGEYGYDLTHFRTLAEAGAVDCLQVDVTRCGGITEWLRVAGFAAAHQLDLSAHCAPYLHLAVAAATPHLRHVEYFHDHVRVAHALLAGVAEPVDGLLHTNETPGHGFELRENDAAPYRVA